VFLECQLEKVPQFCPLVYYRESQSDQKSQRFRYYYSISSTKVIDDVSEGFRFSAAFLNQTKVIFESDLFSVRNHTIGQSMEYIDERNKPKVFAFYYMTIKERYQLKPNQNNTFDSNLRRMSLYVVLIEM
jgi:hypothetical protein